MTLHPEEHRKYWLEELVKKHDLKIGIELGVAEGITFTHLINTCQNLFMIGVDTWNPIKRESKEIYEEWEKKLFQKYDHHPRAQLIKGNTSTVHKLVSDGLADFIFIDAGHSRYDVKRDIENWSSKVKKGGWICGHDEPHKGVNAAITEAYGSKYKKGPDMIWYIKND